MCAVMVFCVCMAWLSQELDPELLKTVRAPLVAGYATKEGIEALLSLLLQKVLSDRPDDLLTYLIDALIEWKPRMVVIVGPPASGKYTLSYLLAKRLALEHVSPSELVEGMIANDTIIGEQMQRFLDSGESIPDDLLETVILARLRETDCRDKGWVMDGWPRTPEQAQRLVDEGLCPQIAVVVEVDDIKIEDRVSFRLENAATGRLYHYYHDPPPLGEQRKCRVRAGETTLEILERLNLHHQRLPLILQRLSQCGGNWHEIKLDLNAASMEEYQQLAEELARQIGV